MNYLKIYCNLIRKAENRTSPEGYTEKHHTFPVSIFGKNNRIVVLTAREHYIAHALLEKAFIKRYGLHHYRTQKMNFAHSSMKCKNKYANSYLYENARKRRIEIMKEQKINCGKNHPLYRKPRSEETKRKISGSMKGNVPSEESNKKRSETLKGKNNPSYGKKWWNDGCGNEVFSIKCPPNWYSGRNEEVIQKGTETRKGRKWWNDGCGNTKFAAECPGENWVSGRGQLKNWYRDT